MDREFVENNNEQQIGREEHWEENQHKIRMFRKLAENDNEQKVGRK